MKTIRFERDGAIGNITLRIRPSTGLTPGSAALRDAVHQASESDIRVLVGAEGLHFSFGGEVREWPGRRQLVPYFRGRGRASYRAIEGCARPPSHRCKVSRSRI
jgi:enoyl-CoA hydratase/carnithine racemase